MEYDESLSPDLLRVDSSAGHCWSSIVASFSCPNWVAGSSPKSTSSSEDITHTLQNAAKHTYSHTLHSDVSDTHTRIHTLPHTQSCNFHRVVARILQGVRDTSGQMGLNTSELLLKGLTDHA